MTSTVVALRSLVAGASQPRERALVIAVAVVLVLLRSGAFVLGRAPEFDSDQAIVGLMAKHLSEFRALPIFFYGQDFMLAVEAWLAAPLFLIAGPSVTALKLPLLGIHLAVTLLLLRMLQQELQLRPLLALVPTLFFIAAPVGTVELMLEANGGNVEPFLYVLLLWLLRRQPLMFGAVLGVGFLNREFTAYGFAAIVLIEVAEGTLTTRSGLRDRVISLVPVAAIFHVVEFLNSIGTPRGPGTTIASDQGAVDLEHLVQRSCWAWSEVSQYLTTMFTSNLSTLYTGGIGRLWLVLGVTAAVAGGRVVHRLLSGAHPAWRRLLFPAYLFLVGLIAAVVPAVARCGAMYERYTLLALLGLVGVAALFLKVERHTGLRAAVIGVLLLGATVNAAGHLRYAFDYFTSPPGSREVLADYLVSNGIRFARSDYWTAYHVSFLTREQVIVASDYSRILYYQRVVAQHDDEAVEIGRTPCEDGHEVEGFHVCPPS